MRRPRSTAPPGCAGSPISVFPLLANLYLVCTLLSTIFTLGDFNTATFVSGGGPALTTHVLATLGIRDAFEIAQPRARRRGGDVGIAADDPAGVDLDAQVAHLGGAAMSAVSAGTATRQAPANGASARITGCGGC